jgi:hypothetical protein
LHLTLETQHDWHTQRILLSELQGFVNKQLGSFAGVGECDSQFLILAPALLGMLVLFSHAHVT